MSINKLAGEYGIHMPEELKTFLKSIFDDIQKSQLVEAWEGDALARYIFEVYDSGIRDRDLLVKTVSCNYQRPRIVDYLHSPV